MTMKAWTALQSIALQAKQAQGALAEGNFELVNGLLQDIVDVVATAQNAIADPDLTTWTTTAVGGSRTPMRPIEATLSRARCPRCGFVVVAASPKMCDALCRAHDAEYHPRP